MSANAFKRFRFTSQLAGLNPAPFSAQPAPMPGDTAQDVVNMWDTDATTYGRCTIPKNVWTGYNPYYVTFKGLAIVAADLNSDVIKTEFVFRFRLSTPNAGSLIILSLLNLSPTVWTGDDQEMIPAASGGTLWTIYNPRHGRKFDSVGGTSADAILTDGAVQIFPDETYEYRIDLTGKDLDFLMNLRGCLFMGNGEASRPAIYDVYSLYVEQTLRGGSNASATSSSAG